MWQQITLIGNLGGDPELKHTTSGVAVASFSLAVNKSWTSSDGEPKTKTLWVRITAWRKTAEIVDQYLKKGSKVLVVGELEEARSWTDKNGNQKASIEVTAMSIKFLDSRSAGQGEKGSQQDLAPIDPDEIPF